MIVPGSRAVRGVQELPRRIDITARADGRPVAGAMISVTLEAAYKNDFPVVLGPTDAAGRAGASRDDLIAEGMKSTRLFPMDYSHPEASWSGVIRVSVMGRHDVERALVAFASFRSPGPAGARYEPALRAWRDALAALAGARLSADVNVDPPGAAVVRITRTRAS